VCISLPTGCGDVGRARLSASGPKTPWSPRPGHEGGFRPGRLWFRQGVLSHGPCRGRRRRHQPGGMVSSCSNWRCGGGFPGSLRGRYLGTGIL